MTVQILEKEDEQRYSKYVSNSIFEYSLEWKNIVEDNFGFKGYILVNKEKGGEVSGVLPLFLAKGIFGTRLVSTPFAVIGEVLADNEGVKKSLIDYAKRFAVKKNVDFLELREKKEGDFPDFKLVKSTFNFYLHLSRDPESVWKKLPKSSVRWGIKKAKKSDLTYSCGKSEREFSEFYELYAQTRKHRGVPGYPNDYLREILNKFESKIYVTRYNGKAIAAIFLIYHNNEVRYMFAGAKHDVKYLRMQPYHLIIWEAVKDACEKGFGVFNFGGATLGTNEGGLYDFKKKWADEILELPYYFYLVKSRNVPVGERILVGLASKVWKRMPLFVTKILSPKVIKQFI